MNKKIFIITVTIVVGVVLCCIWFYLSNRPGTTQQHLMESDVEFSWQMTQDIPRVIRTLSKEENAATTMNYTVPPTTIIIPEGNKKMRDVDPLNAHFQDTHWPPLREVGVPAGSLEVRVWIFISEGTWHVFRLCRNHKKWSGYYTSTVYSNAKLTPDGDEWKLEYYESIHPRNKLILDLTPQTSWESFWGKVEKLGILTLPDSSTLPNENVFFYGVSYVVEINDGEQYRIYGYRNPEKQEWPEAENFNQIINTFRREFYQSLPREWRSWF